MWNSEQPGWKFHNRDGWLPGMNNRRIAKCKEIRIRLVAGKWTGITGPVIAEPVCHVLLKPHPFQQYKNNISLNATG